MDEVTDVVDDVEAQLRQQGEEVDAAPEDGVLAEVRGDLVKPAEGDGADGKEDGEAKLEAAKAEEEKPEEKPADAKKPDEKTEDERERAWQKLEEEKAALKVERERMEGERKGTEEAAAKARLERESQEPLRDKHGYSAEDYDRAARNFAAEGDEELAESARKQGDGLRQAQGERQQRARQEQWSRAVQDVCEAVPELKDQTTPLSQEVRKLLAEHPAYSAYPDGFQRAVNEAKARMGAATVPDLQKRLDALTKENERLTKMTSLPGSNPARRAVEKGLGGMPLAQQERELRKMAAMADSE